MFLAATALPFHRKWTEVTTALAGKNRLAADAAFQALAVDVAGTPLLIEKDRFALLTAYTNEREKWIGRMSILRSPNQPDIMAAVTDRGQAARQARSPAAVPLEAARLLFARSAAASDSGAPVAGIPADASLAKAFSSLVNTLGSNKAGGSAANTIDTALAPAALSEASRELLSVVLNDRP